MKKLISLLALALVISSCGNKMTLLKRHYTKGYYIQHSNKSDNQTVVHTTSKEAPPDLVPVLAAVAKKNNSPAPELVAMIKKPASNLVQQKPTHQAHLTGHRSMQKPNVNRFSAPSIQKKASLETALKSEQRKGDANLIVMVILAFFPILCLIAVYLHDGSVTTNFWIDLILHLTVIGEIIFALLVVLDVVNFA